MTETDLNLRVLPNQRKTAFVSFRVWYLCNGYLEVISNEGLDAAYWHELGHMTRRSLMALYAFFLFVVGAIGLLFLPVILFPGFLLMLYLCACYFLRQGEYEADRYSLEHSTPEGVMDMLQIEGERLDLWYAQLFYPFRWHPCYSRRVHYLKKQWSW